MAEKTSAFRNCGNSANAEELKQKKGTKNRNAVGLEPETSPTQCRRSIHYTNLLSMPK